MALLIAALAASAGASTCALAPADAWNRAEEMAIQGLGFELFLGLMALAGAALSAAPVRERLGLRRGRLPAGLLVLLALGTVSLSHALDAVVDLAQLGEQGTLAEPSRRWPESAAGLCLALLGLGWRRRRRGAAVPGPGAAGLVPRLGAPQPWCSPRCSSGRCIGSRPRGLRCRPGLYLGFSAISRKRGPRSRVTRPTICARCRCRPSSPASDPPAASIGRGGIALAALAWVWRSLGSPPGLEDSRRDGSAGPMQLGPTGGSGIGRL
jgi:hypothetical protein